MYFSPQSKGLAMATTLALTMATSAQAQVAVRDAETGKLRAPTAAETQALAGGDVRTGKKVAPPARIGMLTGKINPEPVIHRDGTVEQELDASTMSYTVVRRNADGTLTMECATGEDAAYTSLAANRSATRSKKGHSHDVK
jgi:hypothetical protein